MVVATERRGRLPTRVARPFVRACLLLCATACRPASTMPTTPTASPTAAGPASEPAPAPRVRAPEEVVAVVDGVEIREADLTRLTGGTSPEAVPPRAALVLQAVERLLIAREAVALGVTIEAKVVDQALQSVASAYALSIEQLQAAVATTTRWSWEDYRSELAAQLLEGKLVVMLNVVPTQAGPGAPRGDDVYLAARGRLLGCLRARAVVSLSDPSVTLPENPLAAVTTVEGLRFTGDPVLPVAELAAAVTAVTAGRRLCDSFAEARRAMLQLYRERGYLQADVEITWPTRSSPTMTLDVAVTTGPLHVFGAVRFDQSAVPKRQRLRERDLVRATSAHVKAGAPAVDSAVLAAADAVRAVAAQAGLGAIEIDTTHRERGKDVALELTYRLSPSP